MSKGLQPQYSTTINFTNARNSDIIKTIESNYPKAVEQVHEFAKQFQGETARETAYKVWKFLRNYIKYKKDNDREQIIQLPSWLVSKSREGDCLKALG